MDESATLTQLIERSESRIDRTNSMICQLTSVVANLTQVYDEHLRELEKSRNDIISQNTTLIGMLESEHKKCAEILHMHERLVNSLISQSCNGSSNSFSVGDIASRNQ